LRNGQACARHFLKLAANPARQRPVIDPLAWGRCDRTWSNAVKKPTVSHLVSFALNALT
jgi:hypothetical protein